MAISATSAEKSDVDTSDWVNITVYNTNFQIPPEYGGGSDSGGNYVKTNVFTFGLVALEDDKSLRHNYGYESTNANPDLAELLSGGGMQSMMWTISLIMSAMVFGGIVDCTGMMGTMAGALLKVAKGTGGLVAVTIFSCVFVN
ncbi:MAG: hypothetical protein J6P91_06140, partial [Methanobrevibacter sp.]|nr:hypothetical protein [Methanobrevibacter sp.]